MRGVQIFYLEFTTTTKTFQKNRGGQRYLDRFQIEMEIYFDGVPDPKVALYLYSSFLTYRLCGVSLFLSLNKMFSLAPYF